MEQGAIKPTRGDGRKRTVRPDETVLQVCGVSKRFDIPAEKVQTLKERVIHPRRRSYRKLEALKRVDLDVKNGEFLGIVGRNGSGKSTLLKCIAGVYQPSTGTIAARGRMATFIELGVGFNPELDARDNVILNATLLGLTAAQSRAKFDDIIAFAELEEFVDMKLKNYSSGMQVRLAFSVALQTDAEMLLIDEVLAVGDAAFQQKCFDVFDRLRAEKKTVIFVTHDMQMVVRFCTRAIMLERGEQVAAGDPEKVARAYTELNMARASGAGVAVLPKHQAGAAEILECWAEDAEGVATKLVVPDTWFSIKTKIRFDTEMEAPIFALTILDQEGALAFEAAASSSGFAQSQFYAGDEIVYEVRVRNCFGEGQYRVSPSVSHADGTLVAALDGSLTSFASAGSGRSKGYVTPIFEQNLIG